MSEMKGETEAQSKEVTAQGHQLICGGEGTGPSSCPKLNAFSTSSC